MKIIRSMQAGGVTYIPFIGQRATSTADAKTQAANTKKNALQDEIASLLKENGLPSDVNRFLNQVSNTLSLAVDGEYSMTQLIDTARWANMVRHNNELHKNAVKRLESESAGSEAALTTNGELYVYSPKGLTTVSPTEYAQHKDDKGYQVLTNNDLLYLRQEQDSLAFDGNILNNLSKTVGLKSVSEYVVKLINDFGTDTKKTSSSSYSHSQLGKIKQGLQQLIGDGPEGFYKIDQSSETSHQGYDYSKKESFEAALNYLYQSLPQDMRNVLRAQTAADGLDPTKDNAKLFLVQALSLHTDHKIDTNFDVDYEGTKVSGKSGSGSGSGGSGEKVSYAEEFQYGRDIPMQTFILSQNTLSSDGRSALAVPGQIFTLQDKDNNTIPQGNLKVTLDKFAASSSLDRSSITFGDQDISMDNLNRLVTDGSGQIGRVVLPIDQQAAHYGIIKPDLAYQDKYNQLKKWIDSSPGVAPNMIREKALELGMDIIQDERGQWIINPAVCRTFAAISALASTAAIKGLDEDSKWLQQLGPNEVPKRIQEMYEQYVNYTGDTKQKSDKLFDSYSPGFFQFRDKVGGRLVRGQVFIPILEGPHSSVHAGKTLVDKSTYYDMGARYESAYNQSQIKSSF